MTAHFHQPSNLYRVCYTLNHKKCQTYFRDQDVAKEFDQFIRFKHLADELPFVSRSTKCARSQANADLPVGVFGVKANDKRRKDKNPWLASVVNLPDGTRKNFVVMYDDVTISRKMALEKLLERRQKFVDEYCTRTGYCLRRHKFYAYLVNVPLAMRD